MYGRNLCKFSQQTIRICETMQKSQDYKSCVQVLECDTWHIIRIAMIYVQINN